MVIGEQTALWVPLVGLAWGVLMLYLNREVFTNPRQVFRRMAEARAKQQPLRRHRDVDRQFEILWSQRWLALFIAVMYFVTVGWFFIRAI